jgi:predicted RNase H-like HicB family nuclease
MQQYIGLIHKETDSDFGVSFPDFPGVATAGTSLADARQMAEEALTLHVEGMIEDGEAIPEPSSLDDIMAIPDNRDGVVILVGVKTEPPKTIRVNVTFPEDILAKIDRYTEEKGLTRSAFLAQAATSAIDEAA